MPLSSFAPLYGLAQGVVTGQSLLDRERQQRINEQLAQLQLQNYQQQQRALSAAGTALSQLPPQQIPQPTQQPTPQLTLPQVPNAAAELAGPGAVRGSWFGNAPGWRDPSDSGLQASGLPVSAGPGIALPTRSTLGQQFDVTAPSGQTMRLPQTDVGPAAWTGRGVDINAPAAQAMGYTPQTFPTDQIFKVALHRDIGQNAMAQVQSGIPTPAVTGAHGLAREAINVGDFETLGRNRLAGLMQAVDKADPEAPPAIKFLAVQQLNKLLAPDDKMMLQYLIASNRDQMRADITTYVQDEINKRQQTREADIGARQQEREGAQAGRAQAAQEARAQEAEKARTFRAAEAQKTQDAQMQRALLRLGQSADPGIKAEQQKLRADRQRANDDIRRLQADPSTKPAALQDAFQRLEDIDEKIMALQDRVLSQARPRQQPQAQGGTTAPLPEEFSEPPVPKGPPGM